ncbi:MAG: DUF4870 domain-containing protein [Desulfatibacillaceae bacterium]
MEHRLPPTPTTRDERLWASFCHLSALLGYFLLPFWIPAGNIVGPLVIWLVKREDSAFIDAQGKEAVNFQISMTLYALVALFLKLVLIGFLLFPLVFLVDLVLLITAAVKASDGAAYRYPATIRFIQ